MPYTAVVTGATGFIGSHLCKEILDAGGNVICLVRTNSKNLSRLPVNNRLTTLFFDNNDMSNLAVEIKRLNLQIDAFYHLAWEGVGSSSRNDTVQVRNIQITIDTLNLAKKINSPKWVGTGSQAEYGVIRSKIDENHPTNPTTLYGASKLAACHLSQVQGKELQLQTVWARVFSTYGPGDNSGWMLIDLIKNLLRNQQIKLTPGEQLWDYLYVKDAATALLQLGLSERSKGIYNLGSGKAVKIKHIVEAVKNLITPDFPIIYGEIPYRPDQVMHLEANTEKLISDTDWIPQYDLDYGLRELVEYVKSNMDGEL
jgi:UDP-glucose 4-epimerase